MLHHSLPCRRNEEKIIYFLLLSRKERQPSVEDEQVPSLSAQFGQCPSPLPPALGSYLPSPCPSSQQTLLGSGWTPGQPHCPSWGSRGGGEDLSSQPLATPVIMSAMTLKRLGKQEAPQALLLMWCWHACCGLQCVGNSGMNPLAGRSQSIGSANLDQLPSRSPRLSTTQTPSYSPSSGGYYTYSSFTPPPNRPRKTSYAGDSATLQVPGSPWKRKFSKKVKDFMGSPRFHRRRMDGECPVWLRAPPPSLPLPCPPQPQR